MAYDVFDKLLKKAIEQGIDLKSKEAIYWFKNAAAKIRTNPKQLSSDRSRLTSSIVYGKMYAFYYDAKLKKELPYWDKFPLVFPFKRVQGGFLGLNMHYLPPYFRAKLMDGLWDYASNTRMNEYTRLLMSYKLLNSVSKLRYFTPCIKHYLIGHLQSKFIEIDSHEWNSALFLPLERFQKASKETVWKDSIRKL